MDDPMRRDGRRDWRLWAILFFWFAWSPVTVAADGKGIVYPGEPFDERVLMILVDPVNSVELMVTIVTPSGVGAGPYPLLVMNHGANGARVSPEAQQRYRRSLLANYFLARGYAVAFPMMRGYGGSEGREGGFGCNQEAIGRNNARDLRMVLDYVSRLPGIDGNRIIMAGQSFGGWNTLAFGTIDYPAVRGLVNVAGGVTVSNCLNTVEALGRGASHYGAETRAPSIWFYGDNDSLFSPAVWRTMYGRYTAAGGRAELVPIGNFMNDAHNFLGFPESLSIFSPRIDAFLARIGMPYQVVAPVYLPLQFPPATGFAAIGDVDAAPYLEEEGRARYREYLAIKPPKVFMLSTDGAVGVFSGGVDPLGDAMRVCRSEGLACRPYAADDVVVWSRPTSTPPPSHFAAIDDVMAAPLINDEGRRALEEYRGLGNPKVFVIGGDGRWWMAAKGEDPVAKAMGACLRIEPQCRLYAVDNDVVWTGSW